MRHYPPIIDIVSTNLISSSIVGAVVSRISVLIHHSAICEGLGVVFGTLAIVHASCCWIGCTTWPVNHTLLHRIKKLRLSFRIRPPGRNSGVDVLWCQHLRALLQKDEEVHVRQTSLLKLDGIHIGNRLAKNPLLVYVLDKSFFLHIKHTRDQVWAVRWRLT